MSHRHGTLVQWAIDWMSGVDPYAGLRKTLQTCRRRLPQRNGFPRGLLRRGAQAEIEFV
jgi:hypothetical protein